ncbi:MAG: hypothetical protein R3D71_06245 [Rickettsiales bacterium]
MHTERRQGLFYSLIFHLLLILLLIFGLPSLLNKDLSTEPVSITVELLPIKDISNLKSLSKTINKTENKVKKEIEKTSEKASPIVKTEKSETPEPKPEVETKKEPEPEPVKPEPKPEKKETPKPEKKPEPKPKPKPKPKKKIQPKKEDDLDLDAILKSVKDTAAKQKTDEKKVKESNRITNKSVSSNLYDPSKDLSISQKDNIMSQIAPCWNPPSGAKDAHELIIVIDAEFDSNGNNLQATIANESRGRYNSDNFFRAAADAALRAVRMCGRPLKNLPPEKYDTWKFMKLRFDPREMLF